MAKKTKDETPNPNSISNRDIIQRLNFLYQASAYLNSIVPQPSTSTSSHITQPNPCATKEGEGSSSENVRKGGKWKKRKSKSTVARSQLSRLYIESMRVVGQKTMVKIDPSVKRTLCKGCQIVLIPGLTAKVRIKTSPSHGHLVTYICMECMTSRRIPAPPVLHEPPLDVQHPELVASSQDQAQPQSEPQLMSIDAPDPTRTVAPPTKHAGGKKKKKAVAPRRLPHFARKVGHVVFRGNETVIEE